MRVLVPLAEGFEEIEAITVIDVLRRAKLDVVTVHLGSNPVVGSHAIPVTADRAITECNVAQFDAVVLPGGMPGSKNLKENRDVISFVQAMRNKNGYCAAICAAPIVLAHAGILQGKKVTSFPGYEQELAGAEYTGAPVQIDGRVITGKGAGAAIDFALALVEVFVSVDDARALRSGMQVYWEKGF